MHRRRTTSHAVLLIIAIAAIPMALGGLRGSSPDGFVTQWNPGYVVPPGAALTLTASYTWADEIGARTGLEPAPDTVMTATERADPATGEASLSEEPTQVPVQYLTHEVQPGDTLNAIADQYGVSIDYLLWNNPMVGSDPDSLIIGQNLLVPGTSGLVYDVRLGDTITDIAARYGVHPSAVVAYAPNGLSSPDLITEGMTILVPGAIPPPPPVVEEAPPEEAQVEAAAPVAVAALPAAAVSDPAPAGLSPADAVIVPSIGFIWPIGGPLWSGFGPRWGSFHKGIDIGAGYGTGIAAAATGQVILSTYSDNGYGNYVIVRHSDGSETLYGHMSERYVSLGQWVNQGDILGAVGCTGWCNGDHLHFEVHVGGAPVNPLNYLP